MKQWMFLVVLLSSNAFSASSETISEYVKIQNKLASDTLKDVPSLALKISEIEKNNKIRSLSKKLSLSKTLDEARAVFKELSESIIASSSKQDLGDLKVASCPMAKARWLQKGTTIQNPYYGKSMLECGEISQ